MSCLLSLNPQWNFGFIAKHWQCKGGQTVIVNGCSSKLPEHQFWNHSLIKSSLGQKHLGLSPSPLVRSWMTFSWKLETKMRLMVLTFSVPEWVPQGRQGSRRAHGTVPDTSSHETWFTPLLSIFLWGSRTLCCLGNVCIFGSAPHFNERPRHHNNTFKVREHFCKPFK